MNWWTLRATCLISWLQFEYALYWPSSLYSLNWTTLHRLYSSVQMIRHNRWPAVAYSHWHYFLITFHPTHMRMDLDVHYERGGYITHLRKLEKAAIVAFMEMPISAIAKLNTRKLLGVLSSLTLRKASIVTAFRKKPSRPLGKGNKKHTQCKSARSLLRNSSHLKAKENTL